MALKPVPGFSLMKLAFACGWLTAVAALSPLTLSIEGDRSAIVALAGAQLREQGVVALSASCGVVGRGGACATLHADAQAHFSTLLDTAIAADACLRAGESDLPAAELAELRLALDEMSFEEVRRRGSRRYDLVVSPDGEAPGVAAWADALEEALSWGRAVVSAATGCEADQVRTLFSGCVASLPGADDQGLHADGGAPGLFNVFMPLVPLPDDATGPTQFAPGTHRDRSRASRTAASEGAAVWAMADDALLASPTPLEAGDLVIFDYRVLHRGLANRGTSFRPVLYATLATSDDAADTVNFPPAPALANPPHFLGQPRKAINDAGPLPLPPGPA